MTSNDVFLAFEELKLKIPLTPPYVLVPRRQPVFTFTAVSNIEHALLEGSCYGVTLFRAYVDIESTINFFSLDDFEYNYFSQTIKSLIKKSKENPEISHSIIAVTFLLSTYILIVFFTSPYGLQLLMFLPDFYLAFF